MDLSACKTIVLFGGSFDPPHVAHVKLPTLARQALGADAVAYLPAARSPLKRHDAEATAAQRVAMLRIALRGIDGATVLTDEIDRAAAAGGDPQPSYTVDTLRALRDRLGPRVVMRLLIGADQARDFESWREPRRIEQLAEPAVCVRPPDTADSLLAALPNPDTWRSRLVELPLVDVSSTEIRRRLATGESTDGLLDPAVASYIAEHGIYGVGKGLGSGC